MRVSIGLNIGSPNSAGGAGLIASRKEHLRLLRETPAVRVRFFAYVFRQRWADDLLLAYRRSVGLEFRNLLRDLTEPFFYGADLLLKRVGKNASFGNRVATSDACALELRNSLPFVLDESDMLVGEWGDTQTSLHGGPQWRSKRITSGVVRGHLLRTSMGAGLTRERTQQLMLRMALELLDVGVTREVVKKNTLRATREKCLDLRVAKRTLLLRPERQKIWREMFDASERYDRVCESMLVRLWADEVTW